MTDCEQIDRLVTPYVDGAASAAERDRVDQHALVCWQCRSRLQAEQRVHSLIADRKASFEVPVASHALRARCTAFAAFATPAVPRVSAAWRARAVPYAIAASLVLLVAGAFVYELTRRSTTLLAAELAADHLKCFRIVNSFLHTHQEPSAVQRSMASRFDWNVQLPAHAERAGMELVGGRPCLYGEGLVAHLMYRHNGHPVSIFMMPRRRLADEERLEVFGHQAVIWSAGARTFVLIANEPRAEVDRMSAFVHSALR